MKRVLNPYITLSIIFWAFFLGISPARGAMLGPGLSGGQKADTITIETLRNSLNRESVRKKLEAAGFEPDEVDRRLAQATNEDLEIIADQVDGLPQGGFVLDLLLIVLIALLIVLILEQDKLKK